MVRIYPWDALNFSAGKDCVTVKIIHGDDKPDFLIMPLGRILEITEELVSMKDDLLQLRKEGVR